MGKHSKNNNDRAFFSNAERKAAAAGRAASAFTGQNDFREWGWGTETRTLDSDSMKDLDACSLSLQPCVEPIVTPNGVLFDKGVVIEYILTRRREIEKETKAWEAQQAGDANDAAATAAAAQEARISEFIAQQEGLSQADLRARSGVGGGSSSGGGAASASGSSFVTANAVGRTLVQDNGVHAADTSFWATHNTPAAQQKLDKPDSVVRCPVTNEPLRLKAMTAVIFTPAEEGMSAADLVGKAAKERYVCPLSKKALTNANPATVLKPSGMVVSTACVKDFIRKDMRDPFTDPPAKLKEKDLIPLRVEGTGFAARTSEEKLKVSKNDTGGGGGW